MVIPSKIALVDNTSTQSSFRCLEAPSGETTASKFLNKPEIGRILAKAIDSERSLSPSKNEISYELVIETQMGFSIFGLNLFNNLFHSQWQSSYETSFRDIRLIPFDDINWKWCWQDWYVVMLNDVDDKGWSYNHTLKGDHWKGVFRFRGASFVRRRIWCRLKIRKDDGVTQ
ncbi:hypothetical protein WICMUC_005240 [Wickerhamomyces mucosus]|uniref:Peroxin/Ferlin domain-containing protein n=1 Tax=Wickerhamomyces mucosus TaxID=1378264 RepID=A0A9P8PA78_9ASCO|nr:hypothetical protein WICMUC_005240 [Wickerhamomyces mucosus]